MTDAELLEQARSLGFTVLDGTEHITVDPDASRLLPPTPGAFSIASAGGVLSVLLDHLPTPGEFRDLERTAGLPITVSIAPAGLIDHLRAQLPAATSEAWAVAPILTQALDSKASDVHLAAGTPPVIRVHGELQTLNVPALSATDMEAIATWVVGEALAPDWDGDLDCAVTFSGQRFRASVWRQRGTPAVTLRVVPAAIPRMEDLGLPASVVAMSELTYGLVLFCGPTGSGKSTSMAALVDRINRTRSEHILTIEDPVEYVHTDHRSLVRQREVGPDTSSFAVGLRAALRQDPDVILVGELRDVETMQTALTASETGHLVLATVHASSTPQVINRIVNSFPANQQDQVRQQLAAALQGVVAQRLLPSTTSGRVLACEVMSANTAVRNMIRDNRLHELPTVLDTSGADMQSMDRSLASLVANGLIHERTASPFVSDRKVFTEFIRHMRTAAVLDEDSLAP